MTNVKAEKIINNEVRQFANYANVRAIPSLVDGLKPSQRKIIACAYNLGKQIKVSQLGAKAAEQYDYHHGEASIISAAVGLAQGYPGSNNFPLLNGIGQFGNRLVKMAAAPRYIFAELAKDFDLMFHKDDMDIMEYVWDEGVKLEPKEFLPALPVVLINGCDGTGNGFKSFILQHNPKDIAKAVEKIVNGKDPDVLLPWVRGFTGVVQRDPITSQITFLGKYEKISSTTLLITELPPKYDLEKYKVVLNDLIERKVIKDYDNESNEDEWKFRVDVPRSFWDMDNDQIINRLKLVQRETQNLVLWSEHGDLKTFNTVEEIVVYWTAHRLKILQMRKDHKIKVLSENIDWLTIKRDFIIMWNSNAETLVKLNRNELKDAILKKGFSEDHIDRLMSLRITSLTLDEVAELEAEIAKLSKEKARYEKITPKEMISLELDKFKS